MGRRRRLGLVGLLMILLAACAQGAGVDESIPAPGPRVTAPVAAPSTMPATPVTCDQPEPGPRLACTALRIRGARALTGMTAAVVDRGSVVWAGGVGWADSARQEPATVETVYAIGSITKEFTAAAIMALTEDGRLDLADPVSRFVAAIPENRGITIEHLLRHTSGLPREFNPTGPDRVRSEAALAAATKPLLFAPGAGWSYSNLGYFLLGLVVEAASGEPYEAFVRARFLEPLELRDTSVCTDGPSKAGFARGYKADGSPAAAVPMLALFGFGDICSTVPDLIAWQTAVAGGRAVGHASLERMLTITALGGGRFAGYGLGLMVEPARPRLVQHGGNLPGFASWLAIDADSGLAVVMLTNTYSEANKAMAEERLAAYRGR